MNNSRRFGIACAMILVVGCGVAWHFLQTRRLKQRIAVLEHAQMQAPATHSPARPKPVADRSITAPPPEHRSSNTEARVFYSAHALSYRGQRDVESTLQSMYWAINAGESKSLAALIEIPIKSYEAASQFYDRLPADSRANKSLHEVMGLWITGGIEPISGFEIINSMEGADTSDFETVLKSDPAYRTVKLKVQWNGATTRTSEQQFVFRNTGQGWVWVLTPELIARVARFASSFQ